MKSENPSIGAFYQCHKRPKSVIATLESFRKFYPDSDVYLVCDGGFDYENLAQHFNCQYEYCSRVGNGQATMFATKQDILNWLGRLLKAAQSIKEDYILILEDDVRVLNKIQELTFDLNGINPHERIGINMTEFLKGRNSTMLPLENYYYGGCGGSLINKKFLLDNFKNLDTVYDLLDGLKEGRWKDIIASDYYLTVLTLYFGGTVGQYKGFCETWHKMYKIKRFLNMVSVVHQDKSLYAVAPDEGDEIYLGKDISFFK